MPRSLRLTRRLRHELEVTLDLAALQGYLQSDLRWLEKYPDTCPVCGQQSILPGTIGLLYLPNYRMTVVPFVVCQRCATQEIDPNTGDFNDSASERTRDMVLRELRIELGPSIADKVPSRYLDDMEKLIAHLEARGALINLWWLQERTHECPACRKPMDVPGRPSATVLEFDEIYVAVVYFLCPSCAEMNQDMELRMVEPVMDAVIAGAITDDPQSFPESRRELAKVIPFPYRAPTNTSQ